MLTELSVSQFAAWREYAEREPFGAAAWDLRIGYVLAVIVQALTGQPTQPADYVPRWTEREPPRQDWREMYAVFQDWKHAHHRQNQSGIAG